MKTYQKMLAGPAALALVALTLSACGDDSDDKSSDEGETTSQESTAEPTSPSDETSQGEDTGADPGDATGSDDADPVVESAVTAIAAAEKDAGGTAYEIDEEDGGWEVDVAVDQQTYEVLVDADGKVIATEDDGRFDGSDRQGLSQAKITIVDAIRAAVATEPAGRLDDVDLEHDRGDFVWEVSFDDGNVDNKVYVDVVSGEVVRTSVDD